jgi:hypothetical protein
MIEYRWPGKIINESTDKGRCAIPSASMTVKVCSSIETTIWVKQEIFTRRKLTILINKLCSNFEIGIHSPVSFSLLDFDNGQFTGRSTNVTSSTVYKYRIWSSNPMVKYIYEEWRWWAYGSMMYFPSNAAIAGKWSQSPSVMMVDSVYSNKPVPRWKSSIDSPLSIS